MSHTRACIHTGTYAHTHTRTHARARTHIHARAQTERQRFGGAESKVARTSRALITQVQYLQGWGIPKKLRYVPRNLMWVVALLCRVPKASKTLLDNRARLHLVSADREGFQLGQGEHVG